MLVAVNDKQPSVAPALGDSAKKSERFVKEMPCSYRANVTESEDAVIATRPCAE